MPKEELQVLPPANAVKFEDGAPQDRSMLDTAISRQAQEVQAAMVIAKKFPRDTTQAYTRIIGACKRRTLAAVSAYAYPRGGTTVTGPSIRLAEALQQNWGNIDSGIIELEQMPGVKSIVMSYAWDLETNSRSVKVFDVPHVRSKKSGNEILTDPRDIYELVANQGARRLRACILAIIPGDVVEAAMEQCTLTLRDADKESPLEDRIRKMVASFKEIGVSQAMIEKRLGHNVSAAIEIEFVQLRKIFTAIKDGAAKREDFFELNAAQAGDPKFAEDLTGGAKAGAPARTTRKPAAPAVPPAEPPAPGGEPEPEIARPPEPEPEQERAPSPADQIRAKCSETQRDPEKVLRWMIENRFAEPSAKTFDDLPPGKAMAVLASWAMVEEEVPKAE